MPANLSLVSTGPLSGTGALNLSSGVNLNVGLAPTSLYAGNILVPGFSSLTFTNSGFQTAGGLTVDNNGELRLGAGQSLRSFGSSNILGKIELLCSPTLGSSEIEFVSGGVTIGAATGFITGRDAVMRFTGGLDNSGSLLLSSGVNDITGDIVNEASGKIMVAGGAAATFYDEVNQNGTLQVLKVGSTTSTAVFAGDFQGSGGSSGGGDIFFLGDLRPGNSPASVSYDNNVAFGPGASLQVELGGTIAGSQYDRIQVSGDLSLDGMVDVSLIDGFTLSLYDEFLIADVAGTLSGEFNGLSEGSLVGNYGGTNLFISYQAGDGNDVALLAAGLPGDFDLDRDVDGEDFLLWQIDPSVGALTDWEANYGTVLPPPLTTASAVVPEPNALALLSLAGLLRIRSVRHSCPCARSTAQELRFQLSWLSAPRDRLLRDVFVAAPSRDSDHRWPSMKRGYRSERFGRLRARRCGRRGQSCSTDGR